MVNTAAALARFKEFASHYPIVTYKKGDIIVRDTDAPQEIYFINTGKIRQLDATFKDDPVVVNIFSKPAFLSILWLFGNTKNNYYYQAYTNVSVHKVPLYDVHKFMLHNPDVMYVTMQRLVSGLDGFIAKMTAQMHGSAEQKIGVELLLETKRFHSTTENVTLDVNVSELSARTGLARETVSRNITQMLDDGLITKVNNKICVVDVARLKEALNI